jgi:hypothetical protein
MSRKVGDEYTVPICRLHHRELHRYGDEASWWAAMIERGERDVVFGIEKFAATLTPTMSPS